MGALSGLEPTHPEEHLMAGFGRGSCLSLQGDSNMKRPILALAAALMLTQAYAADFTMRPGRWEMVLDIKMARSIPGMLGSEPLKMIACPTEPAQMTEQLIKSVEQDGACKVSGYRPQGDTVHFTLKCEEAEFDYSMTQVSSEMFTATGLSRSKDPDYRMTFTYSAKRTGPACSAKELADNDL
jgi:hypothetical protein